jgi:hypothetical protein
VNPVILDLLNKVLSLQDYGTIIDEMKDPVDDVELLIAFILYVRLPLFYLPGIVTYYL